MTPKEAAIAVENLLLKEGYYLDDLSFSEIVGCRIATHDFGNGGLEDRQPHVKNRQAATPIVEQRVHDVDGADTQNTRSTPMFQAKIYPPASDEMRVLRMISLQQAEMLKLMKKWDAIGLLERPEDD